MPITNQVKAYYACESVASLTDSTGNGHTGTQTGLGAFTQIPGVNGNAVKVDGSAGLSYYSVADSADFHFSGDFTLWGWYLPTTLISGGSMIDKPGQFIVREGWTSGVTWIGSCDVYFGGGASFARVNFASFNFTSDWRMWMLEYVSSTMTLNAYSNNASLSTLALDSTAIMALPPIFTTNNLRLCESGAGIVAIDETGFANRLLTSAERDCIFNGGIGSTYPDFCNAGCINFQATVAREGCGSDESCNNYGVGVTNFTLCSPIAAGHYCLEANVVDLNGAVAGDNIRLRIRRKWNDPLNVSHDPCSVVKASIEYDVS